MPVLGSQSARHSVGARLSLFAFIVVAAIVLASSVLPATASAAETPGVVRGIVTGRDGLPVHGALVYLISQVNGSSQLHGQAGVDGSYVIPDVPPGQYRVTAVDFQSPFPLVQRQLKTYAPNWIDDYNSAPVYTVVSGQSSRIDIQMRPSALLWGWLTKETGGPASGVKVFLWRLTDERGWEQIRDGRTGADGHFHCGVDAGRYRIGYGPDPYEASDFLPGYYDGQDSLDDARIIEASENTTIPINGVVSVGAHLEAVCRWSGQLHAPQSAELWRRDEATGHWTMSYLGATHHGVRPGTYRMAAVGFGPSERTPMRKMYYPDSPTLEGAGDITVTPGGDYTVEIEARQLEGITGRVTSAFTGLPVPRAEVTLWQQSAGGWTAIQARTTVGSPIPFAFEDLAIGTYRITVHDPLGIFLDRGYPAGTGVETAQDIEVGIGERPDVDVQLEPDYGTVRGYVRNFDTRVPVSGVPVVLWLDSHVTSVTVISDAAGYYEFRSQAGAVSVQPVDPTGAYVYFGELPVFFPMFLNTGLAPRAAVDYDVEVAPRPRITGQVLDAESHAPISGIQVSSAYGAGPNPVTTGPDGSYSIYVDVVSTYIQVRPFIRAEDPEGRYLMSGWSGAVEWGQEITATLLMERSPTYDDHTPPITTSNAKSSYVDRAQIGLTATDPNGSGVSKTFFVVDNGQIVEGTSTAVIGYGGHAIRFWSTDIAGNVETTKTATFSIVLPSAVMGTPAAPSKMYKGRLAVMHGSYAPAHNLRRDRSSVKLLFYKKDSLGRYRYHHSVTRPCHTFSYGRSYYTVTTSLPHRGTWRVRATHSCSSHSPAYSSYDYITVK